MLGWRYIFPVKYVQVAIDQYSDAPTPGIRRLARYNVLQVRPKRETTLVVEGRPNPRDIIEDLRVRLQCSGRRGCGYERVVTGERFHTETARAIELKLTSMSFD